MKRRHDASSFRYPEGMTEENEYIYNTNITQIIFSENLYAVLLNKYKSLQNQACFKL
jgi:hypothetical protein